MAVLATTYSDVRPLLRQVSPARLKATVEKLASWNTRNTNTPELTEAAEWLRSQYAAIPGMQVELMKYTLPQMRRVPQEKEVVQVVAKLPGEDDHIILVGGHFDTINMTPEAKDLFKARAPGANDDGSGTALALELARVMSTRKWKHTLVFVAFSGEEQGLFGSQALAKRAKDESWKLDAVFSNDMVGNSQLVSGPKDSRHVRLFSDDYDTSGKNHQNSREFARFIEWQSRQWIKNHGVKLVQRRDRFGRGGDHTSFSNEGFNAVRFTDVMEEYGHQHTTADLPEAMDFSYLANNARINLAGMAALANAGDPPTNVRVDTAQNHDCAISWHATPGNEYVVYWRDTRRAEWQKTLVVGAVDHVTVPHVSKDDNFFAVGAVGGIPVVAR